MIASDSHKHPLGSDTDHEDEQEPTPGAVDKAHDRALGFLSFRPRSAREISKYLGRKGYSDAATAIVVARLASAGLVDDRQFAEYWVANRRQFSPRGKRALVQELRLKGIDRGIIESALEDAGDDHELAVRAGRKKLPAFRRLEGDEFRRKMVAFLSRRGFGYGQASEAAAILWSETEVEMESGPVAEIEPDTASGERDCRSAALKCRTPSAGH